MASIRTSEDLRAYLCSMIKMAGNGTIDERKVNSIVKLSKQVHESVYSEARIMKLRAELQQSVDEFGKLKLHDE
ncbi:hypothetical protein D6833_13115 [Candidatus Parcubacteria bacterium]|nr:MAG: hypothetical protein D6833_13115 [Candidatus Parcubacteria bacterium]